MPPALRIESLWKCYAAGVRGCSARAWVLRGLSLTVQPGERVAIVGAAGSGKTTLVECILGLRVPECGLVEMAGRLQIVDERIIRSGADAMLVLARDSSFVREWTDRVLELREGCLHVPHFHPVRRVAERDVTPLR